jgi:hypothetical protein
VAEEKGEIEGKVELTAKTKVGRGFEKKCEGETSNDLKLGRTKDRQTPSNSVRLSHALILELKISECR